MGNGGGLGSRGAHASSFVRLRERVFLPVEHVVDDNLFGFVHAFECCKLTGEAMETRYVGQFGIALHLFPLLKKNDCKLRTPIIEINDIYGGNPY